ncbi:MAG: hypothetical protein RLZZ31_198 [Actinomycetota bacterium]|jgi:uncharacterized repeat protein (TIGR03843 family)
MSADELNAVAHTLRTGEIEILGRMPWSSNAIFLVEVNDVDRTAKAVYKPEKGERPLWDFPSGLWKREVAAYELSAALGWNLIPPTVQRDDAPLEVGSLQFFIEADFEEHYYTLLHDESLHTQFKKMAAFDFITNNTDRKSGHCLIDEQRHIWGIDNGLSFHADFKLRTVIWEFAGEPLDDDIMNDLDNLVSAGLSPVFNELLTVFEREAVLARSRALLRNGELPVDESGHRYPWPLV